MVCARVRAISRYKIMVGNHWLGFGSCLVRFWFLFGFCAPQTSGVSIKISINPYMEV